MHKTYTAEPKSRLPYLNKGHFVLVTVNPIQFIFEKESENVLKHMKDVSYGTQNRVPQCMCVLSPKNVGSVQQCNQRIIISVVSTTCAHISKWLPKSLANNCPQHVSWQKVACKICLWRQPPAFIKKKDDKWNFSHYIFLSIKSKVFCFLLTDIQKHWEELPKKGNNPKWNGKKSEENEECPECQCDTFIHKDSANLLEDYSIIR